MDKKKLLDEELLFLTFQHFDSDYDGFVNTLDLKMALENIGDASSQGDIEEMIADWDMDHNRQIDFQEFCRMMAAVKEFSSENKSLLSINSPKRVTTLRQTLTRLTTICD